ncbi:4a-hydroxytetrahydrobiopterin dehydratase [Pendulispora albinea]|uniref:Putative pterin-4-alpha-carbinolamine dehydratase n=1 Tax=Pendulispora albinea TaxID=2741071 RepID=A0ABZ2LY45_9BACT
MRPDKLDDSTIDAWLAKHSEWKRSSPAGAPDRGAIVREFAFKDFVTALGFVVRVGCIAERRDHHPDVELGWGRARILWSTHDAKGITRLDLELAESTDGLLP